VIYLRAGEYAPPSATISPASRASIGSALMNTVSTMNTTVAWPLSNVALYVPFTLDQPWTVRAVFWSSGTGTGNIDIGAYDSAGTRLFSLGSTAKSTVFSSASLGSAYTFAAGLYYMAMAHDGMSNFTGAAPAAGLLEAMGVCEQTSAFALPSTATFSRTTRAVIPLFGFHAGTITL